MCKARKTGWIVTAKGGMTIKLETDGTHQKKGFTANYQLLKNEPSGCANSDKIQVADKGMARCCFKIFRPFFTSNFFYDFFINNSCIILIDAVFLLFRIAGVNFFRIIFR